VTSTRTQHPDAAPGRSTRPATNTRTQHPDVLITGAAAARSLPRHARAFHRSCYKRRDQFSPGHCSCDFGGWRRRGKVPGLSWGFGTWALGMLACGRTLPRPFPSPHSPRPTVFARADANPREHASPAARLCVPGAHEVSCVACVRGHQCVGISATKCCQFPFPLQGCKRQYGRFPGPEYWRRSSHMCVLQGVCVARQGRLRGLFSCPEEVLQRHQCHKHQPR
jgi:hypothetical protein